MKKLFSRLSVAIAASMCLGAAHAGILTFDSPIDDTFTTFPGSGLLGHNDAFLTQDLYVYGFSTKAGAAAGDLVGALIDGADLSGGLCGTGLICPSNNQTKFLAAVNDGLPDIGMLSGDLFRAISFDASFIAVSGDVVPGTALILRAEGYSTTGLLIQQDFQVPGPDGNGAYGFATYTLNSAFQNTYINDIAFRGFVCNAAGSCNRTSDKAQFALDNLHFIPEPSSVALVALAALGAFGATSRRRNAA